MPKKLSHFDGSGRANMVDVSSKTATRREAEASAYVILKPAVLKALPKNPKGDALEVRVWQELWRSRERPISFLCVTRSPWRTLM